MNNVAESAFSEMFRVISELQFLGRVMQECEASLCPPGGPGQHVHGPSRGGSDTGWHVRAKGPTGLAHSQCSPGGLLVWSDTPDPHHLPALDLWAPDPGHVLALTLHKGKQTSLGSSGSFPRKGVCVLHGNYHIACFK